LVNTVGTGISIGVPPGFTYRLKSIMHVNTDGKRLRQFLWWTKDDVANALKGELIPFAHIVLVVDEWTDASFSRYVGLKVHWSNE
jgi:hypothetical protein